MNWKELFEILIESDLLSQAIEKIENNESFQTSIKDNRIIEINLLEEGQTEGTVYDFRGKIMYCVKFDNKIISAGKFFILDSLKSQQVKVKLIEQYGNTITFFDFQFILYMGVAADVSSGFTWFRNSVKEIAESLKNGNANLNGFEIENEEQLNKYLEEKIHGFKSLFKSVEEIKNYA